MSTLERAIAIAAEAHAGMVDKADAPYILHPLRVMLKMKSSEARMVAVLHDVVEDCASKGYTFAYISNEGFGERVVNGLRAVTKQADEEGSHADESFEDKFKRFVLRAAKDPIGREVKIADLEDNCDLTRITAPKRSDHRRIERYIRALAWIRATSA